MKKGIAIAMSLVLSLGLLTGCGNSAGSTQTAKAPDTKTVITMVSTYKLPEFEAALEEAHPEIDLQVETMALGPIYGELSRRLRNDHGPDLFTTSLPYGELADYTYDLSAEGFVESYQSAITKSTMINGESHYLPLPGGYYGYIINKTILDELNLELPDTTEDLLNILQVSKDKGVGVSDDSGCGFGLSDVGATYLGAYFTANYATDFLSTADGARWLSDFEAKKATFAGNWEHSVDFIKSCIERGFLDAKRMIVFYNGRFETSYNAFKAIEYMPERKAILTFGNLDAYNTICEKSKDEMVMLPCLPDTEKGNKMLSTVSNEYIAINKAISGDKEKLDAALTVLNYLSTKEGQSMWIKDTACPHSFLNEYNVDLSVLPESIRSYAEKDMIFSNPFPTNLLSFIGKNLTEAAKGTITVEEAMSLIDDYNQNGSEKVEYDLSIVGSVAEDMLYENNNTRMIETKVGNLVADAVCETTGADVALVNGGSIRSSFYKGDVTGEDVAAVCPYNNKLVVSEVDGATLREAITNGIQKTWKPAGQFLQVSGLKYSYKPAANENETAELVSLTYADGTEVKDNDLIKVVYTDYIGGVNGYIDSGDGYTMLNVLDPNTPVRVKLLEETGITYGDALKAYFANHKDEVIKSQIEGRIEVIN
ncbi:MAG: extracellular solute-binding protein [Eubacteriales bacterium]|nr:extracellular solute-binding protein [Eubacteriales bacterium]